MYNLVLLMKSEYSYSLLRERISDGTFAFEEYLPDIDTLRNKLIFCSYDIAIIDEKFPSAAEAIGLFAEKDITFIPFSGDFDAVIQALNHLTADEDDNNNSNVADEDKPKDDRPIKYIEKEIVIEKPVQVKVPVYKPVYSGIRNKFIAVLSLSSGAGATFFTLNFAKMLTYFDVLTAVIEPPLGKPTIFDLIGLEQRFDREGDEGARKFYSVPHVIVDNKHVDKSTKNITDGIEWYVPDPRKPDISEWDYTRMMKLLYASNTASVSIIDCGHNFELECVKNILYDMDCVVVIIDPNPVFVMQNKTLFDSLVNLKREGLNVVFVFNKWNKGITFKQLYGFLNVDALMQIPYVDPSLVYKAFYNCEIPCSYKEVKQLLEPEFSKLIKLILPSEIISGHTEPVVTTSFIKKFLRRGLFEKQKN